MRHLTVTSLLPLLVLSALPAQARDQMVTITPEQIGQVFCIGRLGNDMSPVSGVMNDDLAALIEDAFASSNAYLDDHPGEKPPMGDGVRWSTFPDYADGCTVGDASVQDLVAYVGINYAFSDYPEANYSDTLMLLPNYPENGPPYIWRLYDILLGDGTTTREFLYAALEASAQE
jgi:hypothetical protein